MTQEDKELLLKDLCARLPYGVIIKHEDDLSKLDTIFMCDSISISSTSIDKKLSYNLDLDEVKPYLFPLSSMTEEQKKELKNEVCPDGTGYFNEESLICPATHIGDRIPFKFMSKIIDWLNKNHFDINGLIPMDLAKDATGLNIY